MILMLLLPFIDRGPERRPERRPIAMVTGIFVICAMGYLTYLGAAAGSPNEIDMKVAAQYEAGKLVVGPVGLPRLPQDRRERQRRARPAPDRHRRQAAARPRSSARSRTRRRRCRPSRACRRRRSRRSWQFLSQLKGESSGGVGGRHERRRPQRHPRGGAGPRDVRSHRRALRPHELRHDGGAAPPLARARGRPGARRAGLAGARRRDGHGRPGDRAGLARRPRWSARTSPRACSTSRAGRRPALRWEQGNALALPYADASFDAATVGFGARNFSDLGAGPARDGARRAARAAASSCWRSRRRRSRRCRRSSRCGSTASCR